MFSARPKSLWVHNKEAETVMTRGGEPSTFSPVNIQDQVVRAFPLYGEGFLDEEEEERSSVLLDAF